MRPRHSGRQLFAMRFWTLGRLTTTLLFLGILVGACLMPAQSDTWWQLRTGETIWATRTVALQDSFSHTVFGGYWPNHEWLTQVLFFAVYRAGGLPLLTAIAAALVLATWWIVSVLTPGDHPTRRLMIFALGLIPSAGAWSLRPQLLTMLLVATTVLLLVRRRYIFLPPLFLIWANLHGGVTLGLVMLAGCVAGRVVQERRVPTRLLGTTVLSAASTLFTPLGLTLWPEVLASLQRLHVYGVDEWRMPGLTEPVLLPFWILAAMLVWLSLRSRVWRSESLASSAVVWPALSLLPLAVTSARNVPAFVLVAVPAVGTLMCALYPETSGERPGNHRFTLNAIVASAATAAAVAVIAFAWSTESARLAWHPLPDGAMTAVSSCSEPLYNRYDEGGYLIWFVRDRKVFLDSRQDPYPPALVQAQIRAESSGNYEELFARYRIGCAFLPAESPVAHRLKAAEWSTTFEDPNWVVLARNPVTQMASSLPSGDALAGPSNVSR